MFKHKSVSAFVSLLFLIGSGFSASALAVEPVVWDINSRAELLKGEARGVSVTDNGILTLAPNLNHLFNTDQAYVWSTAMDPAGNVYLGTGHDGKLFRVSPDGKGSLLYKAPELDVTALAIAGDGAIFAATSPDGKVYRVTSDGKAEVYFDPAVSTSGRWLFWAMARWRWAQVTTESCIGYARPDPNRKVLC